MAEEIGKLDIKAHQQWAQSQKNLDVTYTKPSGVPSTLTDAVRPKATELEQLFNIEPTFQPIAWIHEPAGWANQHQRIFTHLTIASLGSKEKREALVQKLSQLPEEHREPAERVIHCLKETLRLDTLVELVKGSMGRYHKG